MYRDSYDFYHMTFLGKQVVLTNNLKHHFIFLIVSSRVNNAVDEEKKCSKICI